MYQDFDHTGIRGEINMLGRVVKTVICRSTYQAMGK